MAQKDVKRKLTAILSADAKGYSRLMGKDEVGTVQLLKEYRLIMANFIEKYGGRVVDSPGDNILAEFGSIVNATECAVKIQETLTSKNSRLPEEKRLEFRIGINHGDVLEDENRIYGDGVNIAARIEGLALPGGICISRTTYDQIKNRLQLGYEYLGDHRVKNIAEPVRVYRVLTEPEATGKVIGEKRYLGRISRRAAIASLVILFIVAGGLFIWNFYLQQYQKVDLISAGKIKHPLPDKPSLAVLAFDNLSGDPKQEYLSDGLSEEIITALSKTSKIFIVARNSSFSYKGKPVKVQQIGRELGVNYVIEGSLRKADDRIRISAQLVDAKTGNHLWADRYDRKLKDLFALQDDITMKIITALEVKLTEGEQAYITGKGTNNLDAYLKVLQARDLKRNQVIENNNKARRLSEEAIKIDPDYAQAYRWLSGTYLMDVWLGSTKSPQKSLEKAIETCKKALSLDDNLGGAHGLLGNIYIMKRNYEKGVREAKRAVELEPNGADAHAFFGMALLFAGNPEDAIPALKTAIRLDPNAPEWYMHILASAYRDIKKYDQAIEWGEKAINKNPRNVLSRQILCSIYSLAGRMDEARAQAKEILSLNPNYSVNRISKTYPTKNEGIKEQYIEALRKAGLPE
jgi:adenylate cyclase